MSEQEDREKLEILSNIQDRVESLVKQYNQIVSNSKSEELAKIRIQFENTEGGYDDDDDDDDDDDWNSSGCSWQSSQQNC